MKHRFEQGESNNTTGISEKHMQKVLTTIIMMMSGSQEKIIEHATKYFHQFTNLLQTLTNVVLESKVPQDGTMQREVDVEIGNKVWLVQILS